MNILFYCNEYPPYKTGGIGTVTKIVAEALVKRGHKVFVIGYYPTDKTLPSFSIINGVHIYRYNLGLQNGKIKSLIFSILHKLKLSQLIIQKELTYTENKIQELITKEKIEILELTDYYKFISQSTGLLEFKKFSIPTILRIHGSVSFLDELKGIKEPIKIKNDAAHFHRCNYISAVSQYSLDYIEQNFKTNNFKFQTVIYNPLEDRFISPTPPSGSNTVLFIGKVVETKGCFSLLKAFNICAAKYPHITLKIIGNGDIEKARQYIKPEFTNRVSFLGFCTREQIEQEIDSCAFACIPTYFENFSMAALEIMGRQRVLIYTERTSGKEVIDHGINGYTINPENITEIANTISILYENIPLRNKLAKNAYAKIKENFSLNEIINSIEFFYTKVIEYDKENNKKN